MTRPAARLGDKDSFSSLGCCVYPPNVIRPSISKVFFDGLPSIKSGDVLSPVYGIWVCPGGGSCILPRKVSSVSKVYIEGRPAAHIGDFTNVRTKRRIITASSNVYLN